MFSRFISITSFITIAFAGNCCITCNKKVQEGIYSSTFYPNLLTLLSAFIVLALIAGVFSWLSARRYRHVLLSPVPLWSAAMVLGIGLGGFADGIVLHQLLQWHEMLSHKIAPGSYETKSINMFWDGIFHLFTWIVTLTGIILLWKTTGRAAVNHSGYVLSGGLLQGWGLFNIVEGIIDHHLLELHYVNEYSPHPQAWNIGFLIFSLILLLAGWLLVKRGKAVIR